MERKAVIYFGLAYSDFIAGKSIFGFGRSTGWRVIDVLVFVDIVSKIRKGSEGSGYFLSA